MGRRENRFMQRRQNQQPQQPQSGFMPPEEIQGVMEHIAQRKSQHASFFVTTAQKMFIEAAVHSDFTDFTALAERCVEAAKALAVVIPPFADELIKSAPLPNHLRLIEEEINKQKAEAEKKDPLNGMNVAALVAGTMA